MNPAKRSYSLNERALLALRLNGPTLLTVLYFERAH